MRMSGRGSDQCSRFLPVRHGVRPPSSRTPAGRRPPRRRCLPRTGTRRISDSGKAFCQLSRQTGGSGLVVSDDAVLDRDDHVAFLSKNERYWSANRSVAERRNQGEAAMVTGLLVRAAGTLYLFEPCEPTRGSPDAGFRPASLVLFLSALPLAAQQRKYLVEAGVAAAYQSFDGATDLKGSIGGWAGWECGCPPTSPSRSPGPLPNPKTTVTDLLGNATSVPVNARTVTASLLYNILIGARNSFYLKIGAGSTKYGSDCPVGTRTICGSGGSLVGGAGFRAGFTPTLMGRGELELNRNKSSTRNLTNVGVNLGLSVMLGSKPIADTDGDGIQDNRDRCPDTPPAPRWMAAAARATRTATACPTAWTGARARPRVPPWTPEAAPRTPTETTSPMAWTGAPTLRRACWLTRTAAPRTATATGFPTGWTAARTPPGGHRGRAGLPRRRGRRWGAGWPRSLPTHARRGHGDAQRMRRRTGGRASRPRRCHPCRRPPIRPGGRGRRLRNRARARRIRRPPLSRHPIRRHRPRIPRRPSGRSWPASFPVSASLPGRPGCRPRRYVALDSVAAMLMAATK